VEFKVALDVFAGPLDLLLYLVKRHEVEITEVPIAKITEDFLGTIEVHIERTEGLLEVRDRLAFSELFEDEMPRMRVVGIFLAVLERPPRPRDHPPRAALRRAPALAGPAQADRHAAGRAARAAS